MSNLEDLQQRYLQRLRTDLPAAARDGNARDWPIRLDHCFMRVILDQLFGGCWYDHLSKNKPAYKQLSEEQLQKTIIMADQVLEGDTAALRQWNEDSLRWRGKL